MSVEETSRSGEYHERRGAGFGGGGTLTCSVFLCKRAKKRVSRIGGNSERRRESRGRAGEFVWSGERAMLFECILI